VDRHGDDPAGRFIIVNKMPGSGKSTLAIALDPHLSTIAVIDKDDVPHADCVALRSFERHADPLVV
jgi:hypothetical protein